MIGLEEFKARIVRALPEHRDAKFAELAEGWDSVAVEVDGTFVCKFPKHELATTSLIREASILKAVRPHVSMPVPDITLHGGGQVFSRHRKIPGNWLLAKDYRKLEERSKQRLGEKMAQFYADLHGVAASVMEQAGAAPIEPRLATETFGEKALAALPSRLRIMAEQAIRRYVDLPNDPLGTIYGFFDGHGWNMAFDHDKQELNGIYDFADSGFGPLHQDFIYGNFISADLTKRTVQAYTQITKKNLDMDRIDLLTTMLRLSELSESIKDGQADPQMMKQATDWLERP